MNDEINNGTVLRCSPVYATVVSVPIEVRQLGVACVRGMHSFHKHCFLPLATLFQQLLLRQEPLSSSLNMQAFRYLLHFVSLILRNSTSCMSNASTEYGSNATVVEKLASENQFQTGELTIFA